MNNNIIFFAYMTPFFPSYFLKAIEYIFYGFTGVNIPLGMLKEHAKSLYTLFFYKNIFYKDIEVEICEILRIF